MSTIPLPITSKSRGSELEPAYASPIVSRVVLSEMGVDMASLHRHNRKTQLPRALNDEAGKLGDDGRKRRTNGSSDDKGEIAEDGFSDEDLRVGGPYLCSIPFSSTALPWTNPLQDLLQHKTSNGERIFTRIRQILSSKNVHVIEGACWDDPVMVSLNRSNFNPEPEHVPIITIFATRHAMDDLWPRTARQIHFLLQGEHFGHVSVDIIDLHALRPPKTLTVSMSDPILKSRSLRVSFPE
ncbi:hypothetical protein N7492_004358 [Penicillium capsulatum]|uniref:Uncharacterized protein n=1 Tax=Penicillium capsulatum TaxID=69766 RepID=A0A9W9I7N7_9EURO|nr:hypothetical protein N7492_004358 [Penicillium capsulatum]KAJ6136523.1 hypothetical protein N7512_001683 [Penicillium capsulatum]